MTPTRSEIEALRDRLREEARIWPDSPLERLLIPAADLLDALLVEYPRLKADAEKWRAWDAHNYAVTKAKQP